LPTLEKLLARRVDASVAGMRRGQIRRTELTMKILFCSAAVIISMASGASAQSAPSTPAQGNAAFPAPSGGGKRVACQAAAQGVKGQERRDQLQLCMAQAHLDCLKQAIDQKIVSPQRRDFVRNCVGIDAARGKSNTTDE
jgi:hypothetical protein